MKIFLDHGDHTHDLTKSDEFWAAFEEDCVRLGLPIPERWPPEGSQPTNEWHIRLIPNPPKQD